MKVAREKVRGPLGNFLYRELAAQGGLSLRLTTNINSRIMHLASGDWTRVQDLAVFLSSLYTVRPGDDYFDDFIDQIVGRLPTLVEQDAVDRLRFGSEDRPLTPQEKVEKALEPPGPEEAERTVLLEQAAGKDGSLKDGSLRSSVPEDEDARIAYLVGAKTTLVVVPLSKIIDFVQDWWRGRHHPPHRVEGPLPRWYPEVTEAIKNISESALVPSDVLGTPGEGQFPNARKVAIWLALDLDVAQQQGIRTVELHLDDIYLAIRFRGPILRQLEEIIRTVRAALPHHASNVDPVSVWFGERVVHFVLADPVADPPRPERPRMPTSLRMRK